MIANISATRLGLTPAAWSRSRRPKRIRGPFTTSRWRRGPRAAPPVAERGAKAKATR